MILIAKIINCNSNSKKKVKDILSEINIPSLKDKEFVRIKIGE